MTRRKRGSPGLTPWEGHAGRGRVGGTPELHVAMGVDDNLAPSPPLHSVESWGWEGPVSPGSSPVLRKGRDSRRLRAPSPPCLHSRQDPHTYTQEALCPRAPLRPRGAGSECSAAVPAPAGIRACSASRPRLPPGGRGAARGQPGGVGGSVSRAGRGRGCGGCREGRGAASQAGKSHTRSGSGDAPAAPLLLDLAADSGPRICIFWQPVEKGRTEPAAFKGTAQAVASPREAVWGA